MCWSHRNFFKFLISGIGLLISSLVRKLFPICLIQHLPHITHLVCFCSLFLCNPSIERWYHALPCLKLWPFYRTEQNTAVCYFCSILQDEINTQTGLRLNLTCIDKIVPSRAPEKVTEQKIELRFLCYHNSFWRNLIDFKHNQCLSTSFSCVVKWVNIS